MIAVESSADWKRSYYNHLCISNFDVRSSITFFFFLFHSGIYVIQSITPHLGLLPAARNILWPIHRPIPKRNGRP